MIIFFPSGSRVETKLLGYVADYCLLCQEVYPSAVYKRSLGDSVTASTIRICSHCGIEAACDPRIYKCLLKRRQANACSVEQLLELTNPRQEEIGKKLSELSLASRGRPDDDDSRQHLAMARLRQLGIQSDEVLKFQDYLLSWHRYVADDRRRLCRDIDAYIDRTREAQRLELLLENIYTGCPQGAGCLPTIVLGVPLAFFLLVVGAKVHDVTAGNCLLAFWVVFMVACHIILARLTYRRWFTNKVIKRAEAASIEPFLIVDALEALKEQKVRNPHVKEMLRHVKQLKRLVQARRGSAESDLDHPVASTFTAANDGIQSVAPPKIEAAGASFKKGS